MGPIALMLALVGLSSSTSTDDDCFSILEQSQVLSATYPKRIAHGVHSLTLADLRHYFNPKANETNNIPTINRNLSSFAPLLQPEGQRDEQHPDNQQKPLLLCATTSTRRPTRRTTSRQSTETS